MTYMLLRYPNFIIHDDRFQQSSSRGVTVVGGLVIYIKWFSKFFFYVASTVYMSDSLWFPTRQWFSASVSQNSSIWCSTVCHSFRWYTWSLTHMQYTYMEEISLECSIPYHSHSHLTWKVLSETVYHAYFNQRKALSDQLFINPRNNSMLFFVSLSGCSVGRLSLPCVCIYITLFDKNTRRVQPDIQFQIDIDVLAFKSSSFWGMKRAALYKYQLCLGLLSVELAGIKRSVTISFS